MERRRTTIFLIFAIGLLAGCTRSDITPPGVTGLRCEGLENPVGIDQRSPRLSWIITSGQRNIMQTAYRIKVASTRNLLEKDSADLWDSGKRSGDESLGIPYGGIDLSSGQQVFWKVKVWTGDSSSSWSEIRHWSMGYLYQNEWKGRWIGFDRAFPWDNEEMFSRLSARYIRKEFHTDPEKEISRATVHIMGLGLYELYLNGQKVGKQVLAPAPTNYNRNVKYNSFDVTGLLAAGNNAVGVVLGNGRYHTMRQHYKAYKIMNFGYPKVFLNLLIRYADGSEEVISTDDSWQGNADGPIRSNNEYDGEIYDAGKEFGAWTRPGYDSRNWIRAEYVQEPGGAYEAQMNEPMAVMDTLRPVSIRELRPGVYILDLGQNMVGWLRMRVQGKRGTVVHLRFAESLREDGSLFTANLRDARATDTYILRGGSTEVWEPSFVYHGFRYVEISGYPGIPESSDFSGMVVHDRIPGTGTFSSSDTLLNQLFDAAKWSIQGNYKNMPVDCPQRDERQPWLGDRAISSYGESFLFDNARLYAKWMEDIMYAQREDGSIPDVAPAYFRYYSDNMTWAGVYLLVAEMLYRQYGDIHTVGKHYPHMKRWLAYMKERYEVDGIMTKDSYGDWCAPPATIEEGRGMSANVKRPSALISTAYYFYYLELMQEFAALSGRPEEVPYFADEAVRVRSAFNHNYLSGDQSYYGGNTLTENLLPVAFGIVPEERRETLLSHIEQIIRNNGDHLSCGVVGVQWLMRTLSRNGMEDLAYRLATRTTYPGWGYMIQNGATTIWELWNGNTAAADMNSQNHVMLLGDLLIWYYEDLAGIRSHPDSRAFKKILMAPTFPDGLDHVDAAYASVHGRINSCWTMRRDSLIWDIGIPANTTAEVYLPVPGQASVSESGLPVRKSAGITSVRQSGEKLVLELGSGHYHFRMKTSNQ
ncbi:MAG: family 78 glycoside hydrolase catalytic domain [Bacteroidales bacterium]